MILKLLLITGVVFVVYLMFFKQKSLKPQANSDKKRASQAEVNDLIECPTCGVYVEVEEAILSGSKYYCSSECITKAS